MTAKRKTPKYLIDLIAYQQDMMRYVDDSLRSKRTVPEECQPDHISSKPEDYWIGMANGVNTMLEQALCNVNCYRGFSYQARKANADGIIPMVGPEDSTYEEWRRYYYTGQ